ncbi:PadR family transcriptional regulator [Luteimicrobium subarcticum]|uniref:DNA-binding PadR family transcriptional regulator n=1 Tax=Luteimicrobium subarcticum TaxID=620910 RepID=A0A2M8WSW2_9MICO|nr:PadR family transcriptional regulator [Luteimicrobium subarcticum]PJI94019.1 DNA-binding PadR family transcriptional regulator [Luteimicrobium subarcticum]
MRGTPENPQHLYDDQRGQRRHHRPERGFGPGRGVGPDGPRDMRRQGGPWGFGPGFPEGFGPGGRGGHGPRGGGPRGGRRGRGDVRAAVLLLLVEQPMHGYQLIQEIAERSGGAWRPSPGAVYPALSLLEDEGLVEIAASEGRRLASLTEAGRTYVTEHADDLTPPWADVDMAAAQRHVRLRESLGALAQAVAQVARTGDDAQAGAVEAVLDRTRREIYLVLAGAAEPQQDGPSEDGPVTA